MGDYKDFTPEELGQEYLRCMDNLSIFGVEKTKTVMELKETIKQQSSDLTQQKTSLIEQKSAVADLVLTITKKNAKLEEEIESLHKRFDQYEEKAKNMEELRRILFKNKTFRDLSGEMKASIPTAQQ